jgi:hypothetical protein
MFFSLMNKTCVDVLKCLDMICSSCFVDLQKSDKIRDSRTEPFILANIGVQQTPAENGVFSANA